MASKILVIGSRSFIAQQWRLASPDVLTVGSRDGHGDEAFQHCDVVVNCAMSVAFKEHAYREQDDCDLRAARLAADAGKHFVMLSTRKVYATGSGTVVLDENAALGPTDHYSANKLESERRIASLLGDRCTILRVANVYGYELGRRSFFGIALSRLKNEQRIVLDVSPFVQRDFIAARSLAPLLDRICELRPAGIYNVGSGIGLPLGRIAQWLIEGYGRGRLEVEPISERDSFVLDISRLRLALGLRDAHYDFKTDITNIGMQLNDE